MRKIILISFIFLSWHLCAQEPLKLAVISDTHFLSKKLVDNGTALQKFETSTGRNVIELHQVLLKTLSAIKDFNPDILLITGDITNHGEQKSHQDFVAQLETLRNSGTNIFVIPGNHDINIPNAKKFIGNKPIPTSSITAKEFEEIYNNYGYRQAIKKDSASLSYLVELNDSTWLLGIDSNKYQEHQTSSISSGRIHPKTMQWTLDILQEAKSKKILVLGMMHHGLIEHMPYQATFMPDYLIDNWKNNAEILADNGLKIIFTGHFHSNDITSLTTSKGNKIYDIETGSLAGYPFPYRLMTLENNKLKIESYFIDSISNNPNLQKEYRQKSEKIAYRVAQSKIRSMSLPIPNDVKETLINLIVRMQIIHMKGDEKLTPELTQMVEQLKELLDSQNDDEPSFELDFPPADNFVEIEL